MTTATTVAQQRAFMQNWANNLSSQVDAAVVQMDSAITILQGGGAAWDNATPAQRTGAMLTLHQDVRALMINFKIVVNAMLDSP